MTTSYEDWLISRDMSPSTIKLRLKIYRQRLNAWGSFDVPAADIVGWLRGFSGWTRNTYQQCLDSIYLWREETGQITNEQNPMRHIKRQPTPRRRPRPLTEDELQKALKAASPRTRVFLLLGYLAGLRAHEIAKFHGRDITEERIRVVGKGGVDASIPTHPILWEVAQTMPADDHWFPSHQGRRGVDPTRPPRPDAESRHLDVQTVTKDVRVLFQSLGIEGASHRARHTFGTMLLRNGANLRVVQDLMRHGSLATTAGYLGVDDDELEAAVSGLRSHVERSTVATGRRFSSIDVEQVAPLLDVHMNRLMELHREDPAGSPQRMNGFGHEVARLVIAQHGRAPDDLEHLAAVVGGLFSGQISEDREPVECRTTTCPRRRTPRLDYAGTACDECDHPLARALGPVSQPDCPEWCEGQHVVEDEETLLHSRVLCAGDGLTVALEQAHTCDTFTGAVNLGPLELVVTGGSDTCVLPATAETLKALTSGVTAARSLV